eukprot:gene6984-11150_t
MALVRKRDEDVYTIERCDKKLRAETSEYPFEPVQLKYSLHTQRIPNITTLPLDHVSLLLEKDIVDTMLEEEEEQSKKINFKNMNVDFKHYFEKNRTHVISWMVDFCEGEKLSLLTLHYAVSFLDRFVQNFPKLPKDQYQVVAASCILIAAKKEECVEKVPTLEKLIEYAANSITKTEITRAENRVLSSLNWNLSCISPSHFLEYFLFFENMNETIQGKLISNENKSRIQGFSKVFIEACLSEHKMINKFLPSKVAAGAIYTARMVCSVDDIWPIWLEKKTGYSKNDLVECHKMFLHYYHL